MMPFLSIYFKLFFVIYLGEIIIRRGRNRNINVTLENTDAILSLGDLENPFSIFSPGLAGIAKNESYISDGVLFRAIARGDANLVLRNILLRLWDNSEWGNFIQDIHEVFPELDIKVSFSQETDETISVLIKQDDEWIPIELAGTGVLQATQILSYIHRFSPKVIVLDEPDSHLHPNNQRILCSLLRRISEERNTQVLLTTHSRHVIDALSNVSNFLWVRNGTVDVASPDDDIGVLLDIGALDIKEKVALPDSKVVVLTEDETTKTLELLLEASGFDLDQTAILPYFGVTNIGNLKPLIRIIRTSNNEKRIVLHRDRDFLLDEESENWERHVRELNVEPFLTNGVDIESHLISADHISKLNPRLSVSEALLFIETVAAELNNEFIEKYVNGRVDVERKNGRAGSVNHGRLATEAPEALKTNPSRFRHTKTLLPHLRQRYRETYGENLQLMQVSEHLMDDRLADIARRSFRRSKNLT